VLEMRKKHGFTPKIHTCSGPDSHNEQTPALKVPLQTELRCHPRRYEQPPTMEGLRGDETPGGSPTPAPAAATTTSALGGQTTAAMALGRTLLQRAPRPRPLLGQRESPLPRSEDDAPVFRSSNGSRTHNGCPANHTSRRINSAAGQAAPLAGEAGDASPPP
jgi:hypothetical protein